MGRYGGRAICAAFCRVPRTEPRTYTHIGAMRARSNWFFSLFFTLYEGCGCFSCLPKIDLGGNSFLTMSFRRPQSTRVRVSRVSRVAAPPPAAHWTPAPWARLQLPRDPRAGCRDPESGPRSASVVLLLEFYLLTRQRDSAQNPLLRLIHQGLAIPTQHAHLVLPAWHLARWQRVSSPQVAHLAAVGTVPARHAP